MQLSDKLEDKFRVDVAQKKALKRLGLFSVQDLLFHFPVRYSDISQVKHIVELVPDEVALRRAPPSAAPVSRRYVTGTSVADPSTPVGPET